MYEQFVIGALHVISKLKMNVQVSNLTDVF